MRKIILILAAFYLFTGAADSQIKDKSMTSLDQIKEYFFADPLVFYPLDSAVGRVDLYIEVPLDNLQFKKNNTADTYEAFVEYKVIVKDSRGDIAFNQVYPETISNTKTEQKSIEGRSSSTMKNFFLPSGRYTMSFTLRDKNNFNEYSKEFVFGVKDITGDKLIFSDVMLLQDVTESSIGEKEITPLINGNIGEMSKINLFYEIRSRFEETVSKHYKMLIKNEKESVVFDSTFVLVLKPGANTVFQTVSADKLSFGNFRIEIEDGPDPVAGKYFTYRWGNMPVNMKEIDAAINQLMYIASNDEMKKMKSGKTKEERAKRFVMFWKSKDPSPNTPKNELMMEYYNRIRIANERYSHYVEGWKTDMGMVFIIYGNPNQIDRHPFEENAKPYEIWTYYDMNRQFIFVDETGYGDYRLTTPIWDDRNRGWH
jgi:GWxTD domain-containing protein